MSRRPVWCCLAFSLAFASLTASPSQAQTLGYPPLPVEIEHELAGDEHFERFRRDLIAAAEARDKEHLRRVMSEDFFWDRDFGGGFQAELTAYENFENAFSLDDAKLRPEYKGSGWSRLLSKLRSRSFGTYKDNRPGASPVYCGPAPVSEPLERRMKAIGNVNCYVSRGKGR